MSSRNTHPSAVSLPLGLLLLALATSGARAGPNDKVKGMAFSSGHDLEGYRKSYADVSLRNLKRTGTEYVHLTSILGMLNIDSVDSYEVTDDQSLRYIIRKCKLLGFKIFLKPIVQTKYLRWRGFIKGSRQWFRRVYTPYMVRMARLAQEEGVEMLSVGSELRLTLNQRQDWLRTIRRVRAVYRRQITYVANHDSYKDVPFWRQLDFISISAYFKLLPGERGPSPGRAVTRSLWARRARQVAAWRVEAHLESKRVLLAEAGSMSKGDGVVYREPWDYDAVAPTNLQDQAKIYDGLLHAFMPNDWCMGVIFYNWEIDPNAGRTWPTIQGYTPQGKPALRVMAKYWRQYS